jgi:Tol biopolymer transport system component
MSLTITSPAMTEMGVILGTAAYMAPEQARGKPVDRRADIWAFGVVLYEMLTGRRLFEGEDVSLTLAEVMKSEPDWTALPMLPPPVEMFLRQSLKKDPRQRVQHIGDVRLALEGAFTVVTSGPIGAGPPVSRPPMWRRALPWAAGLALATAASGAVWSLKPVTPRPIIRSTYDLPAGLAFRSKLHRYVTISPDGNQVVYNTSGGLYVRETTAFDARVIPGTEGPTTDPVLSPDGQSVAFFEPAGPTAGGQLKRIAIEGGASVVLTSAMNPLGMSWSGDGRILYSDGDRIWQVSENGGDPTEVAAAATGYLAVEPRWLPQSDLVLFSMQPVTGSSFGALEDQTKIAIARASPGELRVIRTGGTSARYVPTGHLLYVAGGVIYAVPFDAGTLQTTGRPVPVVEGVETSPLGVAEFDVSANGTLVYVSGGPRAQLRRVIALSDRSGRTTQAGTPVGGYDYLRASPDGTRLAVGSDDGNEAIVWIYELGGRGAMRRLTFEGHNRFPIWSPDGRRVAFQSDRDHDPGIFAQRTDGTGSIVRLTTAKQGEAHIPEAWSPDGRHLSFDVVTGARHSLWILTLDDGSIARFNSVDSTEPFGSVFSPDGRWMAYHSLPSNASALTTSSGIYVEPFPATGARYQAPKQERDFQPIWSPNGAELMYVPSVLSGSLAVTRVSFKSGITFGSPELIPFSLTAGHLSSARRAFDVLPDGRFVGLTTSAAADAPGAADRPAPGIRYVVNWFEELKRLVPVK